MSVFVVLQEAALTKRLKKIVTLFKHEKYNLEKV